MVLWQKSRILRINCRVAGQCLILFVYLITISWLWIMVAGSPNIFLEGIYHEF